ncbi:DUF6633 family protein [Segatella oulorum]|uniref:DUF6633 family protein n=1 Tax=Segatella oulorum TaxID=28136 RepID=UPI0028EE6480|nr:DUF6633 family protein [Segatella oulorum]
MSCLTISKNKEEAKELLEKFNPSVQHKCYAYPERCVSGKAPTLAVVNRDYGEQVVIDWLTIELNDYQNFIGVKEENKATLDVVCELSKMILGRYYFLKLSELMLFFQKLKYGDYGEMYGCVDAMRILRALRAFVVDRNNIIDRMEQTEREKKREEERKNAISHEEYIERKKRKISGL